uniref:fibronectin type III domain-containing protein n=1 Tax=Flavobacterium sp. TaxID=239 RepID=UPI003753E1B5
MNTLRKNTILIALLAFLFPFALNAQDLIIAGTNDVASMLSTNKPKHDGDDPRKKKIKKTPKPVPGCGVVLGYKKNSIAINSIKVEWQHNGDPAKVKYDIRWEETNNTAVKGAALNITPTSASSVQYYTVLGLKPSTSYTIYINANCDISNSGAAPVWAVSPRSPLQVTTLSFQCVLEASPVLSSTFYTITAKLPNEPNTSENTYVFTLRNKLTGAAVGLPVSQPATNGIYTFSNP